MKLLIDMNLSPRWVEYLTDAGFEAVPWSTVGPHDPPDTDLVEFAVRENAVILSHDLDFSAILAATQGRKPSVVQLRADNINPEAIGDTVIHALRQMEDELGRGALLSVSDSRTRIRYLPLRTD